MPQPLNVFSYGDTIGKAQGIKNLKTRNALMGQQVEQGPLRNQLLQEQLNQAQFQYGDPEIIGETGMYGQRGPQGQVSYSPQQPTTAKAPDKQRLYEYAKTQNYQGSFEDFLQMTGSKGINVNNLPALKEGQQYDFGTDGTLKGITTVPGSDRAIALEDREAEQTAEKDAASLKKVISTAGRMEFLGEIDKAIDNNSFWTTGMLGKLGQYWAGSDAAYQARLLERVQGEVALNRLAQAQAASKTGGVFGSLQKAELDLLKNSIQALEVGMSAEQMELGLLGVKEHRLKWDGYEDLWNDPEARQRGFAGFGKLVEGNKIEMLNANGEIIGYYD